MGLQTVSPAWKVRDVAAHLLDTALRKLTMVRDSWFVEKASEQAQQDVVALVNRLNEEGVTVYRRLSPALLIRLMSIACEESAAFHESLDPFQESAFNVSWAGEETSLNWFDTARELTERWHHQQQIRFATGRSGLMTPELYNPVLDCFLRGLPHAFRSIEAPAGTNVVVEISGECGGRWVLSCGGNFWKLSNQMPKEVACRITIPQEIAWRVFTKGIAPDMAGSQIEVNGDQALADGVLRLTAVVG